MSEAERLFLDHCRATHGGASDAMCDTCDLLWQRIDFGWPIQPPRGDGGPVSQRAAVLLALDEIGGEWEGTRSYARRLATERERLLLHGKMLGATVTDLARAGRMSRDTAHRLLKRCKPA